MKRFKAIGFAALAIMMAGPVLAQSVTVNLSHSSGEDSDYAVIAAKFEELAEKYSNGDIDIKIRCCAQLATEDEVFKSLQLGTVDMGLITGNNISPHFPLMEAFVLPYIFVDKAHAYRVLEGGVGDRFRQKMADDTGVQILAFGFVGDRDFYNSKHPITSVSDMEGLKIRTPKNQVMIATYAAFGAAPIPLAWADTPTALQTGTVDGSDNGTAFLKDAKFYEIMPYFTPLEHFSYTTPILASTRFLNKLTDDQREAILRAAAETGEYVKGVMTQKIAEVRTWLTTEGGMEEAPFDKSGFIEAAQKVQDEFAADKGEDFNALLADIRAAAAN